ncbi:MAG: hypothetical protein ABI321_14955 [Polyangia bacterium]
MDLVRAGGSTVGIARSTSLHEDPLYARGNDVDDRRTQLQLTA